MTRGWKRGIMAVAITVANEKGGVGKTTTAVNLAAGLALKRSNLNGASGKILLVDMDPQGHALLATAFGIKSVAGGGGLANLLLESPPPSALRLAQRSQHHPNLYVIPGSHPAMVEAAHLLPTQMASETRLARALAPIQKEFAYIIIDTPPTTGPLLVNSLVAANYVIIPVETSYLGVSGLMELQWTIDQVRVHFRPDLKIFGYLPTLCEEQRLEAQEILVELNNRYPGEILAPIHKASDLAYAHSSHMDVFTYKPPRHRTHELISSSSRPTQEYARLVDSVLQRTGSAG
jgi:chromosome partitioning protein